MLAVKRHSGHIGGIILRKQTPWSGLLMRQIDWELKTVSRSFMACCKKRSALLCFNSKKVLTRDTETLRSKFAGVCQQNGREWVHAWTGDPGGSSWSVVKEAHANSNCCKGLQLHGIKTHKWKIIRCSAITGENLQEGLEWVVEDAKARLFLY